MEKHLKLLLIEDSEDDEFLLLRAIKNAGYEIDHTRVFSKDDLINCIKAEKWDIIITDNEMPSFNAEKAILTIREFDTEIPIIIVSGHISEEQIVKHLKAGAADFVSKDNLTRLVPGIEREIKEYKNRIAHIEDRKALREAEKAAEALINATSDAALLMDADGKIITANVIMAQRFSMPLRRLIGSNILDVMPGEVVQHRLEKVCHIKETAQPAFFIDFRNGMWLENSVYPIVDDNGIVSKIALYSRDITDKKIAEDSLNLQKAFLQKLFDEAPVAIAIIDNTWKVNRINYEFHKLFEYTEAEVISKNIGELIFPETRFNELESLMDTKPEERAKNYETVRKTKSGVFKNVKVITKPIFLEKNQIALFAMYIDITALKTAEKALRESEEKFRAITTYTPNIAIFSYDSELKINFWNQASEAIFGYNIEEAINSNVDELLKTKVYQYSQVQIVDYINRNDTPFGPNEIEIFSKKGEVIILLSTTYRLLTDNNEVSYISISIDITERKKAELEILKLNEELENKVLLRTNELNIALAELKESNTELSLLNEAITEESRKLLILNEKLAISEQSLKETIAAKDKFISIIAHDLKNPLQVLMLSSDILIRYAFKLDENQKVKEYHKIFNSASNLSQLLNDILQWAMAQSGRIEFKPEYGDINLVLNESLLLMNEFAAKKNIIINNNIDKSIFLKYDKNMITAVLRNLISNAVKFTAENGEIYIYSLRKDDKIELVIEDTGVGIKEDVIDKLFRIDVNISTLGTQNEKGTGLGLILCKEFIDRHQWGIRVESKVNIGSKFFIEIPLHKEHSL